MKDVCECRRMRTSLSTHLKTGWSESISEETFMPKAFITPWKESYDKPRQHIRKLRHHFAHKGTYSPSYGFSGSHV